MLAEEEGRERRKEEEEEAEVGRLKKGDARKGSRGLGSSSGLW